MIFSSLKEKHQKAYRLKSFDDVLLNSITPMIEWEGLPESVNDRFIEIYRIIEGAAAIWNYKGKDIVTHVELGGMPDENGVGTKAIARTDNGVVKEFDNWKDRDDIVIIFNNSILMPDMNIGRFSDLLTETELSMKFNVLYSRLYPMPIAKDKDIKKALDEALNNMEVGKFKTILSDNIVSDLIGDGELVEVVNLTDVENADKIQYLSHFRDDLFRWFYSLYGMNSQGSAKMAQQTSDEVNQDNNSSMILVKDRLKEAEKAADLLNKKFGWNVTVKLGECWENRLKDINGDGVVDEEDMFDSDPAPEPAPEPEGGEEDADN